MHIAQALAASVDFADTDLVGASHFARAVELAGSLSPAVVAAYLECRPGERDGPVDLLACAIDPAPLTRAGTSQPVGHGWCVAERIQQLRGDPCSPLHGSCSLVWLEFDDVLRASPDPSVCVCLCREYTRRSPTGPSDRQGARAITGALADAGVVDDTIAAMVLGCLDELDADSHAVHLSAMTARAGAPAKLYLRLPIDRVQPWLERVGWNGNDALLEDLIDWRRPSDRFLHIDVTVTSDGVQERLGLAFPRDTDGERFSEAIFARLAGATDRPGQTRQALHGLRRWISQPTAWRRVHGWPWTVARWIDHKLVFDRDHSALKTYLALRPMPLLGGTS